MICLVVLSVLAPSSLQTFQKEHFRFDICTIVLRAINLTRVVNLKWPFTQRGVYMVCMPRKENPNGWSSRPTDASHMIVSSTIGISHWDKCESIIGTRYWDTSKIRNLLSIRLPTPAPRPRGGKNTWHEPGDRDNRPGCAVGHWETPGLFAITEILPTRDWATGVRQHGECPDGWQEAAGTAARGTHAPHRCSPASGRGRGSRRASGWVRAPAGPRPRW